MIRTVHSLLWLKNFINKVEDSTLILVGSRADFDLVFPWCKEAAANYGPTFVISYPDLPGVPGHGYTNLVIDTSYERQNHVDWFNREIWNHVKNVECIYDVP